MHVYKYAITIPFETNVMYEGTQEEIATKIKQYLIDASNDYGIETFIKDCDVDYIGEDDIELTDEDMDNVLITKESIEALKIMLDNGMIELPEEEENDNGNKNTH